MVDRNVFPSNHRRAATGPAKENAPEAPGDDRYFHSRGSIGRRTR